VECDVVLVTHPHYDHDAVDRVRGSPTVLRDALELRGESFRVRGFEGRHARHFGAGFGHRNLVFVLEAGGLTFCHLGDNGPELPEGLVESVGRVDVLVVPVDDEAHLLSHDDASSVVAELDPSVVLPAHYRLPGLTDEFAPLGGLEGWLNTQPLVRRLGSDRVALARADLPERREVWVFDVPV